MIKGEAIFYIFRLFFRILGTMPKKWGERIGALVGRLAYKIFKKHRHIGMKNLNYAFGHNSEHVDIKELSIRIFENLGKIMFEIAWSLQQDKEHLITHFKIEGFDNIRDAYEKNKGVLALSAHFGNWELLTVIAAMLGYPLSIIYRPLDFKPLDKFILDFRTRFGAKAIPKRHSMRGMLKSLRYGDMVSVMLDQNAHCEEGVFVDFFGHRACTSKGMALLALRTEAPVIPVFLFRTPSGFVGKFLPEIPLVKTGDIIRDVETNTQNYTSVIESVIRQNPDQWLWLHQRWKTLPYSELPVLSKDRIRKGTC